MKGKNLLEKWWLCIVLTFIVLTIIGIKGNSNNIAETPISESSAVDKSTKAQTSNTEDTEIPATESTATKKKKDKKQESQKQETEKNSPCISKSEFECLEPEMTYKEVVSIVGDDELVSQASLGGYNTEIYVCEGEGFIVGNTTVAFQNNELISKTQIGLELL